MRMLPVCSATPSCSSHSQILFHGGLRPFSPIHKEFEAKCIMEDKVFGLSNGMNLQTELFRTHAAKSFSSNFVKGAEKPVSMDVMNEHFCPNELDNLKCKSSDLWSSSAQNIYPNHQMGRVELNYIGDESQISGTDNGFIDLAGLNESSNVSSGSVEPDTILSVEVTPEPYTSGTNSLDVPTESLSSVKSSFEEFFAGVNRTFSDSVNKGENALKSSLETISSSVSDIIQSANEAVDGAVGKTFSTFNKTGEFAGDRLTNVSGNLKETTSKAAVVAVDVLRGTIVAVVDSLTKGTSFVIYSYQSAKELLPPEIRDALNLSEEKATEILSPAKIAFQKVYIAIEGLEESFGLNPNDPIVPFVLFLGTSATLWVFYLVSTYSGYAGDLSPESTLEILTGPENAVLIDIRPEALRDKDGIPDLRRRARFRYASVTLSEVDESTRKLLKNGRELEDTLTAAVIQNLKIVGDSSKVIVLDADGTRSKGIARSLRKLGTKKPYLVQGGFRSWVKQGLRIKELKPETTLTVLNEEAEAILEDINPSPVQALGYGVGFIAAVYALTEWEKTLQLIGIFGLGQTIYRRVSSYEDVEDFKRDVRLLLAPVRVGTRAFSWAAEKLETNGIGLPTSPSSTDVQNRVLQAAAKHESQPSDGEGMPDTLSEQKLSVNENVDLSEA